MPVRNSWRTVRLGVKSAAAATEATVERVSVLVTAKSRKIKRDATSSQGIFTAVPSKEENVKATHCKQESHCPVMQRSVLVAAFVLLVGAVAAAPNGTQEISKEPNSTTPPSTSSEVPSTKAPEEEERPASVEQGYRMPGLYALGTQPFYLQRDPVTGAVDFSVPSLSNNNHRYSSKIEQPTGGSADHDDYDDVIAMNDDESDPIDRKDTLGPNTANDIKIHQQGYHNENHKQSRPTKERFPLISSSYANTKVQGMGVTKPPPRRYSSTTPSGPPPSYYDFKEKTTTESILDFWPQKSSTAPPPPVVPDSYDYYEETPVNEEEGDIDATENEDMGNEEQPPSTTTPIEFQSTPTPYRTSSASPTLTYTKPSFINERPDVFVKPYEEPFRPIYKIPDGVADIPNENSPTRPRPPSIYDLPPSDEISPPVPFTPNRPPNAADKRPSTVFSPPPLVNTYNQQQPNNGRPPPPQIPSIMQQPPKFEPPTKFTQNERVDEGDRDTFTVRTPQIDSQGWKQATYTEAPHSSMSTNKVQFSQVDSDEIYATLSNQPSIKQQLPQGYEPQRPGEYRPQEPVRHRPDLPPHLRQQVNENNNFENGRPSVHFERPNHGPVVPGRHQFDPASIPDGNLRVPSNVPIQSRPPQPPRRSDTRPPSFITHYGNKNSQRFEGVRPKDHAQFVGNNPENLDSPVILPQFRPNAKIPPNSAIGNFRVVSNANRRPPPAYFERLYPPPPPPVGRRVGSQVSTLQMMQHGSFPRPSAREDAPFPNSKPPVSTYEVRPAKYGQQQQGSEERPVFVVYANSGESQAQSDILVGTHGLHKPLPPSHLTEEEPVLNKKPSHQNIPIKADFPYALEKPTEEIKKIPNINNEEIDKDDDDVNIIPNLQDYVPLGIKATTSIVRDTTPYRDEVTPLPTENTRVVSILRPQNKNEFTVSAVMHTGSHAPGGSTGTGSVMVVAPQHRNPVESSQQPTSTTSHESYNFQAPFHPSANVAPSPGNGWSAVKGATENSESLRPGTVIDRADLVDEMHMSTSHANNGNKFDIENFKPELIGGFKPIYSFPEENAPEKKQQQQTTEREEKKM
ncbi:hypothetical protein B566_EDAN006979 [Ephemera danica]|nr:hypothetical protein B566_EDAN006979 [Ephemera danica]